MKIIQKQYDHPYSQSNINPNSLLIAQSQYFFIAMISKHSIGLTLLASAIVFSYAYCLDLFQALQVHFRQPPYNFSTLQFNLMYFFTYLPIFLFNIPIGTIIDRSPPACSMFVLVFMSLFAQILCTIMVQMQIKGYVVIMYIARCFFGVAGEGLFTVQGLIITRFCKDNLEIVLSVALSLPYVFDSLNSLVTTRVYDARHSMVFPWYIGIGVSVVSIIAAVALYYAYISPKKQSHQSLLRQNITEANSNFKSSKQVNEQEQEQEQQMFSLRQLKSFSFTFWILIASSFFTQACLGGFNNNLNDLLVKRFNIPYTDAGLILIIPYSCQTLFSIIYSIIMTKYPKTRRSTYVLSSFLYFCGHLFLYLLPQTQNPTNQHYLISVFFCISTSFCFAIYFTGILASIPCIVDQKSVGTAFGVIGCVFGLSQCIIPFMNIGIIDSDPDLSISYKRLNLFYIFIALAALCFAVYIKFGPFDQVDSKFQDKDKPKQIKSESI